jgi:hypothetical protein
MKLEPNAHTLFFTAFFGGISKFKIEILYSFMGAGRVALYAGGGGAAITAFSPILFFEYDLKHGTGRHLLAVCIKIGEEIASGK